MKVIRAYRFRLYPTSEQEILFRRFAGSCRWLYNVALEQRSAFSRRERNIGYRFQAAELKNIKKDPEFDWLAETPQQCLQQALMDLNTAFKRFFDGISGYPQRKKKFHNDSFRFPALEQKVIKKVKGEPVLDENGEPERYTQAIIDLKQGTITLPKIGPVRWCRHRKIDGDTKNVTIIRDGDFWFASIISEVELQEEHGPKMPPVGIDRNVNNPLVLSNETFFDLPRMSKGEEKHKLRLEQGIARCVEQRKIREKETGAKLRPSRNEGKLRSSLRRFHALQKRRLEDALHKITTNLAKTYSLIIVEDIKIQNMTGSAKGTLEEPGKNVAQKSGLNRSLLALAPGKFLRFLTYKCMWYGSLLIKVPAPYTSQYCSLCHQHPKDDPKTKELSHGRDGMWFECPLCGHQEHADVNAAKNIEYDGLERVQLDPSILGIVMDTAGGNPVSAWGVLCKGKTLNHEVSVATERSLTL